MACHQTSIISIERFDLDAISGIDRTAISVSCSTTPLRRGGVPRYREQELIRGFGQRRGTPMPDVNANPNAVVERMGQELLVNRAHVRSLCLPTVRWTHRRGDHRCRYYLASLYEEPTAHCIAAL